MIGSSSEKDKHGSDSFDSYIFSSSEEDEYEPAEEVKEPVPIRKVVT
jgi:hypothetical protein